MKMNGSNDGDDRDDGHDDVDYGVDGDYISNPLPSYTHYPVIQLSSYQFLSILYQILHTSYLYQILYQIMYQIMYQFLAFCENYPAFCENYSPRSAKNSYSIRLLGWNGMKDEDILCSWCISHIADFR